MTEGRVVLLIFGATALVLIAVPAIMLSTAQHPLPPEAAAKGAVSQFFQSAQASAPVRPGRQVLPEIVTVLPPGLKDEAAFAKLSASGFTCVPDARSASCFRNVPLAQGCDADWRVSLIFDAAGTLKTSEADSRTKCL